MTDHPWKMAPPQSRGDRPGLLKTAFVAPEWTQLAPMPARDRHQMMGRPAERQAPTPVASGATTSRLAALRIAAGMTLAGAGAALAIEPGTLSKWENGRPPLRTSGYIDKMATLYQVDREQILAACRVR
jgi:DNA-binding transcriptional regulator YiaG